MNLVSDAKNMTQTTILLDNISSCLRAQEPLLQGGGLEDFSKGDFDLNPLARSYFQKGNVREAAVLIAITKTVEPKIILTRRAKSLNNHAGQISFPGGKQDQGETALEAAFREAEEEINLPQKAPIFLGFLDPYYMMSGFRVVPVVSIVEPEDMKMLKPNEGEVDEIFQIPLSVILDKDNFEMDSNLFKGIRRSYYTLDWNAYHIWGATAGMLKNLSDKIGQL